MNRKGSVVNIEKIDYCLQFLSPIPLAASVALGRVIYFPGCVYFIMGRSMAPNAARSLRHAIVQRLSAPEGLS